AEFRIIGQHLRAANGFHRLGHASIAMRREMFFVTLAPCLITNEYGVDRHASGVPAPHTAHLPIHHHDRDQPQHYHDRAQRRLFHTFTHLSATTDLLISVHKMHKSLVRFFVSICGWSLCLLWLIWFF